MNVFGRWLSSFRINAASFVLPQHSVNQGLIPWMQSINFGELLPMQLGQIPYTETEKSCTVSVNALNRTEYLYRGHYNWPRGDTKVLFDCGK